LRNGLIVLSVFSLIGVGLLLAVPGLRAAAERMTDADPGLIAVAVVLEVLSCAGYVVLFQLVFGRLEAPLRRRLPLSELAVNSVVSAGGLGGIALGWWVLRTKGLSTEQVARRSVVLFLLTSAVNVFAVIVIGLLMWAGVLPGSSNALLTLLPAAIAAGAVALTLALGALMRALAGRTGSSQRRLRIALRSLAGGVSDTLTLLRTPDPRLLGGVGYWLFDNLVLWVVMAAFGHTPVFWVVAMAYLLGMFANTIPIPGGFVAVEGGLVGMLLLFGVRPASMVISAVVIYRAISLWVPSLIGGAAFLSLRREIGTPLAPAHDAPPTSHALPAERV
jgi:uncharacterized membrane protein YbhN (UPF0104 family)